MLINHLVKNTKSVFWMQLESEFWTGKQILILAPE